MGLAAIIDSVTGWFRRPLVAPHERRRRGRNSSSGVAPPRERNHERLRPAMVRHATWNAAISAGWTGDRGSNRRRRCLERLPGLADDVGIGGDHLLGDCQQGRPPVGPSWRRQPGTRTLAVASRRAVAILIAIPVEAPAGEFHRSRLLGAVGTQRTPAAGPT